MIIEGEGSARDLEALRSIAELGMRTAGVAAGFEYPHWLSFNTVSLGKFSSTEKGQPLGVTVQQGYLIGLYMDERVPEELRPAIETFIQALTEYKNKEQDRAGS